jgi:hypothetical protein
MYCIAVSGALLTINWLGCKRAYLTARGSGGLGEDPRSVIAECDCVLADQSSKKISF